MQQLGMSVIWQVEGVLVSKEQAVEERFWSTPSRDLVRKSPSFDLTFLLALSTNVGYIWTILLLQKM